MKLEMINLIYSSNLIVFFVIIVFLFFCKRIDYLKKTNCLFFFTSPIIFKELTPKEKKIHPALSVFLTFLEIIVLIFFSPNLKRITHKHYNKISFLHSLIFSTPSYSLMKLLYRGSLRITFTISPTLSFYLFSTFIIIHPALHPSVGGTV